MSSNDVVEEEENNEETEVIEVFGWKPSITAEVLDDLPTGEEEEEELFSGWSKLLRWRCQSWKERGVGKARLLRHRATGYTRFVLRQEKTGKIVANHYVVDKPPLCNLQPNGNSFRIWTWMANDCSEETPTCETFGLKFRDDESAAMFKSTFDAAKMPLTGRDEAASTRENGNSGNENEIVGESIPTNDESREVMYSEQPPQS